MATSVLITNPEITMWYTNQNVRDTNLDLATIAQIAASIAQMIVFYDLADDAIDARDEKIDAQIEFMEKLNEYECGPDLEMLNCKKAVLTDLGLPSVDMCSDALRCVGESMNDGHAVDAVSQKFVDQSCKSLPTGWGLQEGTLHGAKSGSHAGGLLANSAKRQQEDFIQKKTALVTAGQQGMKGVFKASTVLQKYAQATQIHSGLADLFIQGFNSAGASLGTALGSLSGTTSSGPTFGGSIPGTGGIGNSAGGGTGVGSSVA